MIDERFGKNTKVKMVLQRIVKENLEMRKKVGQLPIKIVDKILGKEEN